MWPEALLVPGLLGAGYLLGRLHARRVLDRERAFGALANLPDWEIRARALEYRAYRRLVGWHSTYDFTWETDATTLRRAADEERARGRQRDAAAIGSR